MVAFAHITVVAEAIQRESGKELAISAVQHNYAVVLQQAVQNIPNTYYEYMLRNTAIKLGQTLGRYATKVMPDEDVIKFIQKICWCSSVGDMHLLQESPAVIQERFENVRSRYHNLSFVPVRIADIIQRVS